MSGLFGSLNAAASALQAQSLAVSITGKNLANANNAGYSREVVNYSAGATVVTPQGAQSLGLMTSVTQVRDTLLDRQVLHESSLSSYYTTQQSALEDAQAGLGQNISSASSTGATATTTTDTGIGAALDDFFNGFQAVASNPTDTGSRQALISSAGILADRMQQADASLAQAQADLGTQVSTSATSANTLLQTVAGLNSQIARIEAAAPGSAVDLRDQRQAALEQLAALMPVTVTDTGGGQVQVSAVDGSGSPVVLVNQGTVNGAVAISGAQITAGSPATVLALTGGSMQGAIDASTGPIQTLRTQLDQLAGQVVTSVNALYNPTGTTGNFFTASGTTAGTMSVDSSLTAAGLTPGAGGAAGDNTVALAIANLANTKFSTASGDLINGTIGGAFASNVTQFGQAVSTVNSNVTNQTNIETLVRGQRDSVSGVNLDEETANLLKYQRAYEASSRVLQTIDTMLNQVINNLGVGT